MQINVEFEERAWSLDLDDMDMGEARTIQRNTGKGLAEFTRGVINEGDPTCLAWLYWLMHRQNGEKTPDPNRANFKVAQLWTAVLEALEVAANEGDDDKKDEAKKSPKEA